MSVKQDTIDYVRRDAAQKAVHQALLDRVNTELDGALREANNKRYDAALGYLENAEAWLLELARDADNTQPKRNLPA